MPIENAEIVTGLLTNAARYFNKSIDSLDSEYVDIAIAEFYTGIELVFKARLSAEHWSLTISKFDKINQQKFKSGNFTSIGFIESYRRAKNLLGDKLGNGIFDTFDSLRKHRNQIVHFYHGAMDDVAQKNLIVSEMCKAWRPLYELVTEHWTEYFREEEVAEFQTLDARMRQVREYLEVRYGEVSDEVEAARAIGTKCIDCHACGYDTLLHVGEHKEHLAVYSCKVCQFGNAMLLSPCPTATCDATLHIPFNNSVTCELCNVEIDGAGAAELLQPETDRGGVTAPRPYCTHCDEISRDRPSMIREDEGRYMCCRCLHTVGVDEVEQCDHCGALQTNLSDASGAYGCEFCDGAIG